MNEHLVLKNDTTSHIMRLCVCVCVCKISHDDVFTIPHIAKVKIYYIMMMFDDVEN